MFWRTFFYRGLFGFKALVRGFFLCQFLRLGAFHRHHILITIFGHNKFAGAAAGGTSEFIDMTQVVLSRGYSSAQLWWH
jgi:hypothetical protein